ncbi:MAG: ATP-binding protein [Bacteroidota bacterium]
MTSPSSFSTGPLHRHTVGLAVALLVLVGGLLVLTLAANRALDRQGTVHELERDLFEVESAMGAFLLKPSEGAADHTRAALAQFQTRAEEVSPRPPAGGQAAPLVGSLAEPVELYTQALEDVLRLTEARGYDENSGAEGALRERIHAAEAVLRATPNTAAQVYMLEARRREKDYIMRMEPIYVPMVAAYADSVLYAMQEGGPSEAQVDLVAGRVFAYVKGFRRLVMLMEQAEAAEQRWQASNGQVRVLMTSLVSEAEQRAHVLRLGAYLGLFVGLLGGIGLVGWMVRRVLRPIQRLQDAADQLAQGQTTDVHLRDQDELGELAQTLNRLSVSLADRDAAHRELDTERTFIETVLATVHAGIVVYDPDMRVLYWNRYLENQTGVSATAVQGLHHRELLDGQLKPIPPEVIDAVLAGETRWLPTQCIAHPETGAPRWYSMTIAPLYSPDGTPTGLVASVRNETDQHNALALMQEVVEEGARIKTDFLAAMGPALCIPLNGILGLAELLESTPLSEEQQQSVQGIVHSGALLLRAIHDLLDFATHEAERMDLKAVPFAVRKACQECLDAVRMEALEKGVQLDLDVDARVPLGAIGDVERLQHVVLALLSNAVKFTAVGQVSLRVWGHPDSVSADSFQLQGAVRDTGPGLPADRLPYRSHPLGPVEDSTEGLPTEGGLGLMICHRLLEQLGGSLEIERAEGAGTTCTFSVPLGVLAPEEAPSLAGPVGDQG